MTTREEIIRNVQLRCADLLEAGAGWTPDDAREIASLINEDDNPWDLFRFMDERTGDWRVGYKTQDGREWFPILRQMRNTRDGGLFENMRRAA